MIPLLNLASVAFSEDQIELSEQHARRALELAQEAEDDPVRAIAHRLLGQIAHSRSESEQTRSHLAAAVTLFQDTGNLPQTAATRLILGRALMDQGDPRAAIRSLSPARASFLDMEDVEGQVRCLANLALCYEALEQEKVALTFWERATEQVLAADVAEGLRDEVLEGALRLALKLGRPEVIQQWTDQATGQAQRDDSGRQDPAGPEASRS